ncbi:hypothetical protein CZ794_08030 [Psychrobacter sp. JB385]|nr:hypothetical protein CZ794_08030 [Psychrobacter sp. JB385]
MSMFVIKALTYHGARLLWYSLIMALIYYRTYLSLCALLVA